MSSREAQASAAQRNSGLRKLKKLALVLDLDLTLIHCIMVPRNEPAVPDCHDFSLDEGNTSTLASPFSKQNFRVCLRPHVKHFLAEASKQYRLFVYTHGTRPYAEKVTSLLDPRGTLFSQRIVSRTDTADVGKGVKSLSR